MARNILVPTLILFAVLPWFVISGKNRPDEVSRNADRFDETKTTSSSVASAKLDLIRDSKRREAK